MNLFQFLALTISSATAKQLVASTDDPDSQRFYHGTRAELESQET